MEDNQIPILFGEGRKLVGYYPVKEQGAWPKTSDGRKNLTVGDTIRVGRRILTITGITTGVIFATTETMSVFFEVGSGIPLEKY
ncbi:MAG: hypothetical protein ABH814_02845 [bacterium]